MRCARVHRPNLLRTLNMSPVPLWRKTIDVAYLWYLQHISRHTFTGLQSGLTRSWARFIVQDRGLSCQKQVLFLWWNSVRMWTHGGRKFLCSCQCMKIIHCLHSNKMWTITFGFVTNYFSLSELKKTICSKTQSAPRFASHLPM